MKEPHPCEISDMYKELTKIGQGAFGYIYSCTERETQSEVAIKVVPLSLPSYQKTFQKEIVIYKTLKHKNICPLKKAIILQTSGSMKFGIMEMEKMDMDLLSYLMLRGKLSEDEVKPIFREILKGVQYLHLSNIAHLDLKLDNILLQFENDNISSVRLCDFGSAKKWTKSRSLGVLKQNERIGTQQYLAPELRCNQDQDCVFFMEKADVYSLGVMLFSLLTGCFPSDEEGNYVGTDLVQSVTKNNLCYRLLNKMLCDDMTDRISVSEILFDPWLY